MVEPDRRHQRVVLMVEAVPDAVFVGDAHVAHLDGQEIFQRRLPDVAREDAAADLERLRPALAIVRARTCRAEVTSKKSKVR